MKNLYISRGVVLVGLGCAMAVGCNNDFDDKPKANVNPASSIGAAGGELKKTESPTPVSPASAQLSGVWPLEASQSEVGFEGAKITGKHVGSFKKIDGKVSLSGGKVNALNITIDTASVEADDAKLTGHLKSPDFFDVEKFPQSTFVSTQVVEKPVAGASHEITGDLTLHGITKSITFPVSVQADATSAKGTAEFTINRKDFNIIYPGKPDDLIKDDVLLKLKLVFKPSAAGAETMAPAGGAVAPAGDATQGSAAPSGAASSAGAATGAAAAVSADLGKKVKEAADKANEAIKDVAKAAENATGSDADKAAAALKAASEKAKEAAEKLTKPATDK